MLPGIWSGCVGQWVPPETVAALQGTGSDKPPYIRYFEWIAAANETSARHFRDAAMVRQVKRSR